MRAGKKPQVYFYFRKDFLTLFAAKSAGKMWVASLSGQEFEKVSKKVLTNLRESCIMYYVDGSLAQLGEHLPYKQRVIGSSPIVSTNMPPMQVIGGFLI